MKGCTRTVLALLLCVATLGAGLPRDDSAVSQGSVAAAQQSAAGPQWPKPPAVARIRFVRSVSGASDWGIARGWFGRLADSLTGRHAATFVRPTGVAEHEGVLYVADAGAQALIILDAPRHLEIRVDRIADRRLVSPVAVAVGPGGSVFLADSWLKQVLLLDRDGKLQRIVVGEGLGRPAAVAYDAVRRRLYVADSMAHVVNIYDLDGRLLGSVGGLGQQQGRFNSPTHLALARDGRLLVTDALNFRIQVFDSEGGFQRSLGTPGDGAGNFAAPKGVAADHAGHVYAADAMFDAVQVFDERGVLLLGFGEQGTQAGQFWMPNGLFMNEGEQLFVADAYNRRVQVFQVLPLPVTEPGAK
jgi:sugar lactone lactonase YvrE